MYQGKFMNKIFADKISQEKYLATFLKITEKIFANFFLDFSQKP
jgi:hypothetical protein